MPPRSNPMSIAPLRLFARPRSRSIEPIIAASPQPQGVRRHYLSQQDDEWSTMMKTRFAMAASMLAGAALGSATIQALHAQAKPPVYMIAINEVSNQDGYAKEYVPPARKSVEDRG